MASATIIKFPDGRTETRNVITSFEKNGKNFIVFGTDKVDNGHKVVGVSSLEDGMYQNIIDIEKWKEAKGYLVDILHDRMTNDDYRIVPEEVSVTVDPYHPLGLRDENLDKIMDSYETFVATKTVVPVETNLETISMNEEIIPESQPQVIEEPVQMEQAPEEKVEMVQSIEPEMIASEPVVLDDTMSIMDVPLEEQPVVQEAPVIEEAPQEEKLLDPFAIAASLDPVNTEVHQDIVLPVGIDNVLGSAPVVPEMNVVEEPIINDGIIPFPQPEVTQVVQEHVSIPNESVVQGTYEKTADDIINEMRILTEEYFNKMEEKKNEISRVLEEARGINELAKQTFDKAQENVQNIVADQGQSLELTKVA